MSNLIPIFSLKYPQSLPFGGSKETGNTESNINKWTNWSPGVLWTSVYEALNYMADIKSLNPKPRELLNLTWFPYKELSDRV